MANQSTQTASRSRERSREQQQRADWQEIMAQRKHQMDEMMHDHAGQSVLIALVAGFGVGYLVGCALASNEPSYTSRWSRLADRSAAEGLGRRVMESLDRVLPEAISSRFTG